MALNWRLSVVLVDPHWEMSLSRRVGSMLLQGFLYGFFTCVLLAALYLLCMNRRGVPWPLILIMIAMYAVSTADISLSAFHLFRYVLNGNQAPALRPRPSVLFFVSNYALANIVLVNLFQPIVRHVKKNEQILHRYIGATSSGHAKIAFFFSLPSLCWGSRFHKVAGYVLGSSPSLYGRLFVYLWTSFGFSTCLALCIGGRILYSARRASDTYRVELPRKLYSIASVIIDSGVIHSVYLVLVISLKSSTLRAGLSQISGIVSTSVIVQKSLSGYLRQLGDASSIRSAPGSRGASTPVLDSIFSMAGDTTAPSLIATTLPHASAHVLVDTVRDAPEGQSVDVRLHSISSADARHLRTEA